MLTPIMLCGLGRSGTTAMMKLFTSSQAVFSERAYPLEQRYLTYFAKLSELLRRDVPFEPFDFPNLVNFNDSAFGRFPWTYSSECLHSHWPPTREAWLRVLWAGFSQLARCASPEARFYVEKSPSWLPGAVRKVVPCETIYLFRDLRDVHLSCRLWGRTEAEYIRFRDENNEAELAHLIACEFMQHYENYAADGLEEEPLVVRYEEMIADGPGLVRRLEEKFGIALDLDQCLTNWRMHATSSTLADSVGRWQKEGISCDAHRTLVRTAGRELRELGYAIDDAGPPSLELRFTRDQMNGFLPQSSDGELYPEEDCARVEVNGCDYWLMLPVDGFDAEAVEHIWVCVAEGAGNVCSLYWKPQGGDFSESNSFHVEYWPSSGWRVLDFPLNRHPEWRGRIEGLRLDVFNHQSEGFDRKLSLGTECKGTGYLRWLRGFKLSV